jgi:type IV secretory pathway VirB4 component
MAYVPVPKDLANVKTKVALGLTKRQLFGFGAAALIGLPLFFLLNKINQEVAMFGLFIVGAPALFISIYSRDGMPAEEWLKNWIRQRFVRPGLRKYKKPSLKRADVEKRLSAIRKERINEKRKIKQQSEATGNYFTAKKAKKVDSLIAVLKDLFSLIYKRLRKEPIPDITTQDTILYKEMYKDGLCRIDETRYSKTITFEDINYRLAHSEDKQQIFTSYCTFLNSFDDSVTVQLTFINEITDIESTESGFTIDMTGDAYDYIRAEYQEMLRTQIEKGNNGLKRRKYVTFTIEAKNPLEARQRLTRIENDAIHIFQGMSVRAYPISGKERLEVIHRILNDKEKAFKFDWERCNEMGLRTQDFIAPKSMDFSDKRYFKTGKKYGMCQQFILLASELSDQTLADFLDMETEMVLNIHIQAMDYQKAIKTIKGKISDLDKMRIEEQKKAIRAGYDMDVMPPDLETYAEETKNILKELQSQNEKWFMIFILVTNFAEKKNKLETDSLQARSIALKYNCDLKPYDYNQENCLLTTIPLGVNYTYPRRGVTTSAVAVFVPFTTQELFTEGKALYYGLNAISNNVIMANRKLLHNPNGLILGVPGSGKSFSAKREMTNAFLLTNDNVIICDPEGEYYPLVHLLGGQVINVSPISKDYINPLDLNMDYSEDASPLVLKADFVLSMMELICGSTQGLQPVQKSIIDQCVNKIYQKYFADPVPENMPILSDLSEALKENRNPEALYLADALELYVTGSLNVFNHHTNVDITNRFVCYNIKELGKNLRQLGMLIIQDQVWNTVTLNRGTKKSTWYYIDEFHLLLTKAQTAGYSVEIWKRFRKWGGIPTGITQNVKDLLLSMEIENIFENSEFVYMLKQSAGDRETLARKLNISSLQLGYIENSEQGAGLIKYGGIILPFKDKFPEDTTLYRVMTTKPDEIEKIAVGEQVS